MVRPGRLTPHGVSGLKFLSQCMVSGLKFLLPLLPAKESLSHPAWGEWIEIEYMAKVTAATAVSPRMG